jgi:hypothetical protein
MKPVWPDAQSPAEGWMVESVDGTPPDPELDRTVEYKIDDSTEVRKGGMCKSKTLPEVLVSVQKEILDWALVASIW